jgi:hypothetical protein
MVHARRDRRLNERRRKVRVGSGRVLGKASSGWHDSSTGAGRLRKGYSTERMLLGRSFGLRESAGVERKLLAVVLLLLLLGLLLVVAL